MKGVVSVGCIYTLAYLVRSELKRQGIHRPEQTQRLRETLDIVLSIVTATNVSHKRLVSANSDPSFDDIEDSFQYQCAIQSKCDVLITINLKDYRLADTSSIEILSPTAFVEKFL